MSTTAYEPTTVSPSSVVREDTHHGSDAEGNSTDGEEVSLPVLQLSSTQSWYEREYVEASAATSDSEQGVVSKESTERDGHGALPPAPLHLSSTQSWYEREYGNSTSASERGGDDLNQTNAVMDRSLDEHPSREEVSPWLGRGRDTDDLIDGSDASYSDYSDDSSDGSTLTTEDEIPEPLPLLSSHTTVMAIGIYDAAAPVVPEDYSHAEEESQEERAHEEKNVTERDDDEHSTEDIILEAVSGAIAEKVATEEHDEKSRRKEEEAIAAVSASVARRPTSFVTPEKKKEKLDREDQKLAAISRSLSQSTSAALTDSNDIDDQGTINIGVDMFQDNEDELDLEAQAGIPVAIPGAFAVEGMDAADDGRLLTGYDSGFEDDEDASESIEETQLETNEAAPIVRGEVHRNRNDSMLVDGLPVFDDEDPTATDGDRKSNKVLRIALIVACAMIVAVAVIVALLITKDTSGSPTEPSSVVLGEPLLGPEGNDEARFGHSVSLSSNGTLLAVGIPGWDQGDGIGRNISVGQSHIYAFDASSSSYAQLGLEIDGPGPGAEAGKAISLSGDSRRVAVASPSWQGGVVAIYAVPNSATGSWIQIGQTLLDQMGETADFGFDVDLSEDGRTIAVGSPSANGGAGFVHVYQEMEGSWTELGERFSGRDQDFAGYSVAISADGVRVAIGAIGSSLDRPGRVQVLVFNGTEWETMGSPLDGESAQDRFGHAVALSSDGFILAVGASGGISAGQFVRVFQYNEEEKSWRQLGNTLSSSAATGSFGFSVSLSADGGILAIGSPSSDDFGVDSGKLSVFQYEGSDWVPLVQDIGGNEGDSLGYAVSLSWDGRRVAGGSPTTNFDGRPNDVGKTTVYALVEV